MIFTLMVNIFKKSNKTSKHKNYICIKKKRVYINKSIIDIMEKKHIIIIILFCFSVFTILNQRLKRVELDRF